MDTPRPERTGEKGTLRKKGSWGETHQRIKLRQLHLLGTNTMDYRKYTPESKQEEARSREPEAAQETERP